MCSHHLCTKQLLFLFLTMIYFWSLQFLSNYLANSFNLTQLKPNSIFSLSNPLNLSFFSRNINRVKKLEINKLIQS